MAAYAGWTAQNKHHPSSLCVCVCVCVRVQCLRPDVQPDQLDVASNSVGEHHRNQDMHFVSTYRSNPRYRSINLQVCGCVCISVHAVYSGQASALRQNIQSKGRFCKVHVRVVSFFAWSKIARRKRILLCTQPQVRGAVGLTGLKGFDWRVLVGASRLLAWSMTNTRLNRIERV